MVNMLKMQHSMVQLSIVLKLC